MGDRNGKKSSFNSVLINNLQKKLKVIYEKKGKVREGRSRCRSRKIGIKKERKNIKETNKEQNKVKNNETTKIKNKNIFIFKKT